MRESGRGVRYRTYLVPALRPFQVYRLTINDLRVGELQFGYKVGGTDESGWRRNPSIRQIRRG